MAVDIRHRVLMTLQCVESDSYQFCVTTIEILCPILSEFNLFFSRDKKKSIFLSHLLHLLHRDKIHLKKRFTQYCRHRIYFNMHILRWKYFISSLSNF